MQRATYLVSPESEEIFTGQYVTFPIRVKADVTESVTPILSSEQGLEETGFLIVLKLETD